MPLAFAYLLSALCGSMTAVAISVHFAESGHGAFIITGTLLAGACAHIFLTPLLAPLFDRHSAKRLGISAALIDVTMLVILIVWPHPWVLILGTFISSATAGIIMPALFTLAEHHETTNPAAAFSRLDTARLIGSFTGPMLGGLLVQVASLRSAFATEILASLIMLLVLSRSTAPPPAPTTAAPGFIARIIQAPKLLFQNRQTRTALQGMWGAIIFTSIYNIALVFYAVDVLHIGGLGYAILTQAFIVGRIVGAKLAARCTTDRAYRTVIIGGAIMGAAIALAGFVPNVVVAVASFTVAGICNAAQVAALRLLIVFAVPEAVRPKALSTMGTVNTSAMLVGYLLGAPVVNLLGPAMALIIAGVGTLTVTMLPTVGRR